MMSETDKIFESLYDLLRGSRPNMGKALALVEEQLQANVCQEETKSAKEQLLGFLNSLKQFFAKNPNSQQQVDELITIITNDGMIEIADFYSMLRAVLPETLGCSTNKSSIVPASFMDRLAEIFALSSGETVSNQVLTAIGQESVVDLKATALESEKDWQRKLLFFGRKLSAAYPQGHLVDPATTLFFEGNPVDGSHKGSRTLEVLLRKQLLGFHRISGSLRAKMVEGREKAANLRARISQLEEAIALSRQSLFIDPATAIPSRSSFTAHLHRHLERAMHLGEQFSLALVQIQDFKNILSKLGKDEAVSFVKTVASLIRSQIQDGDFLARLGDDRFALILPEATKELSEAVAANIGNVLNSTAYKLSNSTSSLSVKVGSLSFESGMTAEEMLTLTDELANSAAEAQVFSEPKTILNVLEA
ncbi:MAG: GGDEF domain-containing protein [Magnetococcales bacterium]|nr:GGDEF domain-containing protein [Magnetococcales bacterium]